MSVREENFYYDPRENKNQATKFAFNLRGSFFSFSSSFEGNGVEIFLPRNFAAAAQRKS